MGNGVALTNQFLQYSLSFASKCVICDLESLKYMLGPTCKRYRFLRLLTRTAVTILPVLSYGIN